MLSEKQLEILRERRAKVLAGGGEDKLQERHAKGLLGARERLLALFQPDTFQEIATHAKHAGKHFGLADKELPSDGVIVGTGFVDGRPVAAFSQDFTVMRRHAGQDARQEDRQVPCSSRSRSACPVVGVQGLRRRPHPGRRWTRCPATARCSTTTCCSRAWCRRSPSSPVPAPAARPTRRRLMDFIIMTRQNAPHVHHRPGGDQGGHRPRDQPWTKSAAPTMHATVSGNVHFVAEDDAPRDPDRARLLLSYLPSNNTEDPPHRPYADLDLSPRRGHQRPDSGQLHGADGRAADHQAPGRRRRVPGSPRRLGRQHRRRLRPHPGHRGRHRRQPAAGQGRGAGHRRLRQGRALHPLLQRLQHPAGDAGGRARLPARHRAGARRHHPPRRQDAVRLRLGDGAEDHHHPAQGLRRLLSRHVQPGDGRRHGLSPGRPPRSR
ncbi:MAG: hypothetical protein MZW92_41590 [Comamonadaceae bacterium]|nr:hypothetical protein [Comamonadaceae bacterium]